MLGVAFLFFRWLPGVHRRGNGRGERTRGNVEGSLFQLRCGLPGTENAGGTDLGQWTGQVEKPSGCLIPDDTVEFQIRVFVIDSNSSNSDFSRD